MLESFCVTGAMTTDTSGHGTNDVNAFDCSQAAAYEACRVFRDRLVSSEHTARFDSIMADTLRKHWRINLDLTGSVFATLGGPAAQLTAGKDACTLLRQCKGTDTYRSQLVSLQLQQDLPHYTSSLV